ncbi:hypothetical protein L6R53_11605 [Myxococcota bacterium]|nr:hypothetical protein [Myxococcota bacterium]
MNVLPTLDPAVLDLLLSTGLSLGLLASAALTIASLPWTDREISQVDQAAHQLVASPVRRVLALSRAVVARG